MRDSWYVVVSWSCREGYLKWLGEWVEEKDARRFSNLDTAIHIAECHSYFSCSHLEVLHVYKDGDWKTVYRTEFPNWRPKP